MNILVQKNHFGHFRRHWISLYDGEYHWHPVGVDDARCVARLQVHVSAICRQLVHTGVYAEHGATA
jgi:hypothetical protein